nr:spore germination protein [Alteribacillus iranensis]
MLRRSLMKRTEKKKDIQKERVHDQPLKTTIEANISDLKQILGDPDDLVVRYFTVGDKEHAAAIVYINGLIDTALVQNNILENLQTKTLELKEKEAVTLFDQLYREFISVADTEKSSTMEKVLSTLLSGGTVFYLDGISEILVLNTAGGENRSIEEPVSESLIRGPRAGFIEDIGTNAAMIRREIHDPSLRMKTHQIGERSKKTLAVFYIDGVIHPEILAEMNRRLDSINIDSAIDSGYVEEWIEDSFLSPFPQIINTERPDKSAAAILQGKAVILVDGSPFALIAPIALGNVLQSPEDYYERWMIGSFIRLLRYLGAFFSLFLPGLYIALVSYHQDLIPSELAFSIAATREGVPFPVVVEAALMVITMEFLREAGARLPQTIGQTIGIVGGLVIGDAAVQAGIVSPIMVIVIALTAIATFSIPLYSVAIAFRLIRFAIMIGAAIFGLYGIVLVYIMVNIHIVNLKSFGIPYSTPFAPTFKHDWKDLVIRAPLTTLVKRPSFLQTKDQRRGEKA